MRICAKLVRFSFVFPSVNNSVRVGAQWVNQASSQCSITTTGSFSMLSLMDSGSYTEWSLKNALLKVKLISFQESIFRNLFELCFIFLCIDLISKWHRQQWLLICDETRVVWMSSVFVQSHCLAPVLCVWGGFFPPILCAAFVVCNTDSSSCTGIRWGL